MILQAQEAVGRRLFSDSKMAAFEYSPDIGVWTKLCSGCETVFEGSDNIEGSRETFSEIFGMAKQASDGLQAFCKSCARRRRKERRGVDAHDEAELYKRQEGLCAICKTQIHARYRFSADPLGARVDHDHKTGKVRGLLCHNCNILIGMYETLRERLPKFEPSTLDRYLGQ